MSRHLPAERTAARVPSLYWRRAVSWFMVHQQGPVTVVFIDGRGDSRTWTGPIVRWQGEERCLCAWESIRAVEDAGRRVAR